MRDSEIETQMGTIAALIHKGLYLPVKITDGRTNYGRRQYYITPVGGAGSIWVDVSSLKLNLTNII